MLCFSVSIDRIDAPTSSKYVKVRDSTMKLWFFCMAAALSLNTACAHDADSRPRVFVFTDINIDAGDPDDRQSLIHLLWYADELQIEGVVPDRWDARGMEACLLAAEAYAEDYENYHFGKKGYPTPQQVKSLFAESLEDAVRRFQHAADQGSPLYVLIWGNMLHVGEVLRGQSDPAANVRLITIATDRMQEEHRQFMPQDWAKTEKPCEQYNWNGWGRNQIFNDERFKEMWWLEINWTYEGMFSGEEPKEMFAKLSGYGALGRHLKEVVKNEPWAQYFRVGDTPSVLYVIDPNHDLDDPTKESWAGKFIKPFPNDRPNYFTDFNGPVAWDYADPCNTWENHAEMNRFAKGTLEAVRPQMYAALLAKLDALYRH